MSDGLKSNWKSNTIELPSLKISIIIISHHSKDSSLNKIIRAINKKNYVIKKSKLIRIDDL